MSVSLRYLHKNGITISYVEVKEQALGSSVDKLHFAQVILRHGWCDTWEEVFNNYLDADEFHETVKNKPPVRECIDNIKKPAAKCRRRALGRLGLTTTRRTIR